MEKEFNEPTPMVSVDITEFADFEFATGKISLLVPVINLESNLCNDKAVQELKNKFGGKTADEMIDAAYEAIHKISVQKWVAEVLLKN